MKVVITYQHRGDDQYIELINAAFASAKRLGYETVFIGSDFVNIEADHLITFPAEVEPKLMNWILAAQLYYIDSYLFDCNSVIFSPDALFTRPVDEVFDLGFDMAFTIRDNDKWPINNGVIFLNPDMKILIAQWWELAIGLCKGYPTETQDWYGDQLSLYDLWLTGRHKQLGLNVCMLPCEVYNASPRNGQDLDTKLIKSAYIIHLKGPRKTMMQEYWDAICSA